MNRKVSIMLVLLLAVSLMMPVLSYAASKLFFYYDVNSGKLYGGYYIEGDVYSADPDAATVTIETYNGETMTVTYDAYDGKLGQVYLYDDNNNPYVSVTYALNVGSRPTSISVEENGVTTVAEEVYSSEFSIYRSSEDEPRLDVYRMPATQYFTSVTADTYVPAGASLLTFSPTQGEPNSIELFFPHNETSKTALFIGNIETSDFDLVDITSTVTESVYLTDAVVSYGGYSMQFNVNGNLEEGHQYVLKLSNTSSGDEVKMPEAGDYTVSAHLNEIIEPKSGFTFGIHHNSKYFDITISSSSSGSGSGYIPPSDKQAVNESSLKNGKDGKVEVSIANGKKKVLLPAKAAEAVGKNKLVLEGEELTAEIPSDVLADLAELIPADELADAEISFAFDKVSEEDTTGLLDKAKGNNKAEVKAAGDVYEFNLSIKTKDGKEKKLKKFKKPITLKLNVKEDADEDLIGGYFIGEEGELEYVGGDLADGKLAFDVNHFSKYGVLEYNKTFVDVAADFWAADAIKVMAAKHVVNGVNDTDFRPQGDMTRAEFAALIVRALDLKASKSAQFSDVSSDAWYAEAVAAASEAGIINGRSETTFAPNATIKREEMIAMIVRAYELKNGEKLSADTEASFTDRAEASEWAQSYIDAAAKAGLVEGRANNNVAPQDLMTRAEGAQIVYRLLMN